MARASSIQGFPGQTFRPRYQGPDASQQSLARLRLFRHRIF